MARIRSIKPEFWTDEKIVSLSPLARLLFIGMWNFVDDEGRAEYSPRRMKMQILPADDADISELLGEIRRENLILVYEVDNKEYFEVRGFSKHQKVDARRSSKLPSPPDCAELRRIAPTDQGMDQGKGEEAEPIGSSAAAPDTVVSFDARKSLFGEAMPLLAKYTGKAEPATRSLVGKWLRDSKDDALKVGRLIARAVNEQKADPIAWIEQSLKKSLAEEDQIWRGVDFAPMAEDEIQAEFDRMQKLGISCAGMRS